jgi:hypothetical protein
MDPREPPDPPDQTAQKAPSDSRSLFARWPSCQHCARRMLMVSEDAHRYAFICHFCDYRATLPKT